jgi:hypothetical protein
MACRAATLSATLRVSPIWLLQSQGLQAIRPTHWLVQNQRDRQQIQQTRVRVHCDVLRSHTKLRLLHHHPIHAHKACFDVLLGFAARTVAQLHDAFGKAFAFGWALAHGFAGIHKG